MPTRMAGQPASNRRGLVGCVVVHDQMDVEVVGDLGFESAQELEELPAAMTREALSDDCAGGDVEGAVATHSQFDHIGSHHEFGERAVHPSEARYLAEPDREAVLIEPYATPETFSALPPGGFGGRTYAVLPAPASGEAGGPT